MDREVDPFEGVCIAAGCKVTPGISRGDTLVVRVGWGAAGA